MQGQNRGNRALVVLVLAALLMSLAATPAAVAQQPAPTGVRAILVLDNSGSMENNDPTNLRFTAARLFLALLEEGDAGGVILFSTESKPLTDGVVSIGSAADKLSLVCQLEAPDADGWTDVRAAFEDVKAMLDGGERYGQKTVVVFLTDGHPEIPDQPAGYERDTLAVIRGLGVPVMAIALTSAAQTPFLNQVAAQTGGLVVPADEASDLLDAYLEVFGQIKDRTVMGTGRVAAPGSAPLELDPALVPYVEKASFVVGKPDSVEARLFGPGGQEVQPGDPGVAFALFDDPRFAVMTVTQPPGGDWQYQLAGSGQVQARAILHSRLRVEVATPHRFHEVGQPMAIAVRLVEEGPGEQVVRIIGEVTFSALITRPDGQQESLDLFYDDGTHGDRQAGDGDYTRLYVNADQPGSYTIDVRGWKGIAPVERTVRVEAIPFPEIVVDEPSSQTYAIRSEPLLLRAHLEGGTPPQLDQGELVATIMAPSGSSAEVLLPVDAGDYEGAFMPTEDGVHEVRFEARGATYKGLAYTHTAQTRFEAHIIPTVSILADAVDLGQLEVDKARQGVAVTIPVRSSSRSTETVQVNLDGMPAFALREAGDVSIPPSEKVDLTFTFVALPEATAGRFEGELVFTGNDAMDLDGARVPVVVELFQPVVHISPALLDLGRLGGCFDCSDRLTMSIESTSGYSETLRLGLEGIAELGSSPAQVTVPPGTSEVTLVISATETLKPGEYSARVRVSGRTGLFIEPASEIPVRFEIAPVWSRCGGYIGGGVALLGLVLYGAVRAARRVRAATRAPSVSGTLQYWPKGQSAHTQTIDLTELGETTLWIGREGQRDVAIPDSGLEEEHALLRAEKGVDEVQILLEPRGEVRDGYRRLGSAKQLRHGDTFTMGSTEFRYLSDEGE